MILTETGSGNAHPNPDIQTGLIGYKCFLFREHGFRAYGTTIELKDANGVSIGSQGYWKGIFENVPVGQYEVIASNQDTAQSKIVVVSTEKIAYVPFIFDFQTGNIDFHNIVKGSPETRAFGTITKVLHTNGETVYTGSQWRGVVQHLPIGSYRVIAENRGMQLEETVEVQTDVTTSLVFDFPLETGKIAYQCYLDSSREKPAYGVQFKIFALPAKELVLHDSLRWRGLTRPLISGDYQFYGNYFGEVVNRKIKILPAVTLEYEMIFNIQQVRFTYECYQDESESPASGASVQLLNPVGEVIYNALGWRGQTLIQAGNYQLLAIFGGTEKRIPITILSSFSSRSIEKIYFSSAQ